MLLLQVAKEKKVAGQNSQEQIASLSSEEKERVRTISLQCGTGIARAAAGNKE